MSKTKDDIRVFNFYVCDAINHGVEKAVLIYNLAYWILHNQANNKNYINGKNWTYNSSKALALIFPFWNERKIYRMLKQLEHANIIEIAEFNQNPYLHTKWYTIVEESIRQKWKIGSPQLENGNPKFSNSYNVTDNKPHIKQTNNDDDLIDCTLLDSKEYRTMLDELVSRKWVGDFSKLVVEVGSFEACKYYWDSSLKTEVDNSNGFYKGGWIREQFRKNANTFYDTFLKSEKNKNKTEEIKSIETLKQKETEKRDKKILEEWFVKYSSIDETRQKNDLEKFMWNSANFDYYPEYKKKKLFKEIRFPSNLENHYKSLFKEFLIKHKKS